MERAVPEDLSSEEMTLLLGAGTARSARQRRDQRRAHCD
jgi:hypothetical protein